MVNITTLPIELRISILQKLSNISDLSATVSSLQSLAEGLRESPTIVGHVLANEIDPKLWPLAVKIWQMRTHRKTNKVHNEKDSWLVLQETQNTTSEDAWEDMSSVDLTEAHKLHQLHCAIDKFTIDFTSTALDLLAVEAFDELAAHDIHWGSSTAAQSERLHHLNGENGVLPRWFQLDTAIGDLNDDYHNERFDHMPSFGVNYMKALRNNWQYQDPDGLNAGPADIWCQVHLSDDQALSKKYVVERNAGCVMWDAWRFKDIENFLRNNGVGNSY
ncbi:uncharacterized protein N7498_002754 [Penicillium cinerascens]|uniref:Uncharacterized protein n=1 Tax=Penicillium cinerascens TaxID=70096 RepID=A0A9W9TB72_9EURO|nr:uncharacterized protein N7498_002754 [Penicillium cinerascens]KAJ5216347.1 hypothetical protein N7498_002754 [Penicillium cinerascens]